MKGTGPFWARLMLFLTPFSRGSNRKVAIAPERGAQSISPLGHIFRYVFIRVLHPSRPAASMFPTMGDMDAYIPNYCSHSWYVVSLHLRLHSHVFYIVYSRLNP